MPDTFLVYFPSVESAVAAREVPAAQSGWEAAEQGACEFSWDNPEVQWPQIVAVIYPGGGEKRFKVDLDWEPVAYAAPIEEETTI